MSESLPSRTSSKNTQHEQLYAPLVITIPESMIEEAEITGHFDLNTETGEVKRSLRQPGNRKTCLGSSDGDIVPNVGSIPSSYIS